jgi:hypothetical protein
MASQLHRRLPTYWLNTKLASHQSQDARQAAVTHLTQQVVKDQRQHAEEHPAQKGTHTGQPEGQLAGCSPLMVSLYYGFCLLRF